MNQQELENLKKEPGPKMLKEALSLLGTIETPGKGNNPIILQWATEVGASVDKVYKSDEIPWCGLFVAIVAKRAGKEIIKSPLWALAWANFGEDKDEAELGDVLVFVRKTPTGATAGHVGIYVGEDTECYHVLGGNQGDKVSIARFPKKRLYAIRTPKYNNKPENVRKILLSSGAAISTNEQ